MSTATTLRTTRIWADTVTQEVCRHPRCRRTIYFAVNVRTGNRSPFDNRPVPIAEQRELETGRVEWTIDLAQASSHFGSCVGAKFFRRPR
jgi:hypothetical protein